MSVSAIHHVRPGQRGIWSRWSTVASEPYTVGLEEEVMLLTRQDQSLAHRSDQVVPSLSEDLVEHTSQETHAAILELKTGINFDVPSGVAELARLRRWLAFELRGVGLAAACSGTYPLALARAPRISATERYRLIAESMRWLVLRQPTMALHVHVGVPHPSDAVRVLRRIRENLPLLLALSANSPFTGGRDTGMASSRTAIFGAFPRTGPPRAFADYDEYVEVIRALVASGALPDPSFLWWDVRLQPQLGTVEVRVMDVQSTPAETAPLVALVQSLARLEIEEQPAEKRPEAEILAENRFLAARDGVHAQLIDPATHTLVPVRELLATVLDDCRGHAAALGCLPELEQLDRLTAANGAVRQRRWVYAGHELDSLPTRLSQQFTAPLPYSVPSRHERNI